MDIYKTIAINFDKAVTRELFERSHFSWEKERERGGEILSPKAEIEQAALADLIFYSKVCVIFYVKDYI